MDAVERAMPSRSVTRSLTVWPLLLGLMACEFAAHAHAGDTPDVEDDPVVAGLKRSGEYLARVPGLSTKERLLTASGGCIKIWFLVGNTAAFKNGFDALIDKRGRCGSRHGLKRFNERGGKGAMWLGGLVGRRHLLGGLVLLRGGENQRRIIRALRRRQFGIAVGQRLGSFTYIARVVGKRALNIAWTDAAADAAAVAAVKDCSQMNSLIERRVEDARHFAIAHIEPTLVSIGRNERAVGVNIFPADKNCELVALAVDAKRAVAGIVKHHRIAGLGQIDKILLHGGKYAVVVSLRSGQNHNT